MQTKQNKIIGAHGSSKHVQIINFPTTRQAETFIRNECHCQIIIGLLGSPPTTHENYYNECGYPVRQMKLENIDDDNDIKIETILVVSNNSESEQNENANEKDVECDSVLSKHDHRRSYPPHSVPLNIDSTTLLKTKNNAVDQCTNNGNVCIAFSKRHFGLPIDLADVCDHFVHIPHRTISSTNGKSLLNTQACISITLYELTSRMGYHEAKFQGQKFTIIETTMNNKHKLHCTDNDNKKSEVETNLTSKSDMIDPVNEGDNYIGFTIFSENLDEEMNGDY